MYKKTIHIMPMDKFTIPFIEFINKNYPDSHVFFIRSKKEAADKQYQNVKYIEDVSKKEIVDAIKGSKELVIHYFSLDFALKYIFPYFGVLKKTCWIIWGRDLYVYNDYRKTIRGKAYNFATSVFVKKMAGIAVFASKDVDYAQNWLGFKGESIDILYPSTIKKEEIEKIISEKKSHDGINVVLGNSATMTNCHEEVLEYLKAFKEDNVKVYVPLSYGDKEYKDCIVKQGKAWLGEKFIPITEFMDPFSYVKMLSEMDVAIYNNDRQQATGNIEILSYLGAKVFLKKDYPLWNFYVDRQELPFFAVEDIKKMSIEEFVNYSESDKANNFSYFSRIWDEQVLLDVWEKVWSMVK